MLPFSSYHRWPAVWIVGRRSSASERDGYARARQVALCGYQAHRENALVCPPDVLRRVRDEGILRVRDRVDEAVRARLVRRHVLEEVRALQETSSAEYEVLRSQLLEVEDVLRGAVGDASRRGDSDGAAAAAPPAGVAAAASGGGAAAAPSSKAAAADARLEAGAPCSGQLAGRATRGCVGLAPCDPRLEYEQDFRGEFIQTLFREGQTWTFSFGLWYYRLKRQLFDQAVLRRQYRLTQVELPSISQELLMGVINAVEQTTVYPAHDCVVSDLEAGACLLAAYQASLGSARAVPTTVSGVLNDSARTLQTLTEQLAEELQAMGVSDNYYAFRDPVDLRFFAPCQQGRHYAPGTFDGHALVSLLVHRGVLWQLPGHREAGELKTSSERVSGVGRDDVLTLWTRRLLGGRLGRAVPSFVHEQQYLRGGLTAVVALLLLWRVLNSESVFQARDTRFSLRDLFDWQAPDGGGDGQDGAPEDEDATAAAHAYRPRNFEYVVREYVVPMYERSREVTVSQLWPGLVLLAVTESTRSGWSPRQRAGAGTGGGGGGEGRARLSGQPLQIQSARGQPVLEFMLAQMRKASGADVERLETHDALLFCYEHGLGRLLSVSLPRQRVVTLGGSLFNVSNVYDCLYFFPLGFVSTVAQV